jgi:hypothetical protein
MHYEGEGNKASNAAIVKTVALGLDVGNLGLLREQARFCRKE